MIDESISVAYIAAVEMAVEGEFGLFQIASLATRVSDTPG